MTWILARLGMSFFAPCPSCGKMRDFPGQDRTGYPERVYKCQHCGSPNLRDGEPKTRENNVESTDSA